MRAKLAELGVDTRFVGHRPRAAHAAGVRRARRRPRTPSCCSTANRLRPTCSSCRTTSTPTTVRDVAVLWVAGSAMAEEPARSTVLGLLARRAPGARTPCSTSTTGPMLWADPDDARRLIGGAVDSATVAIGNRAECAIAVGTADPDEAARRLLGARRRAWRSSSSAATACSWRPPTARPSSRRVRSRSCAGSAPATPSAGRSSTGCCPGGRPEQTVAYANAAGAIVASRLMCADAMPTADEIDALEVAR